MKAITTQYKGPTNARGSRIIAKAEGVKAHTVSYDHSLNADENHEAVARGLAVRMEWLKLNDRNEHTAFAEDYAEGTLPDGNTRVFVDVSRHTVLEMLKAQLADCRAEIRALETRLGE